ncbi:muscarinic acetylcholine receptor M4-like [Littorina saxatilis]|uniref:G-protein coupled receptors family 1 profile domain-containing protein n=1 Tax=Littorina saxatilis TaxID=31220 RepID=A0AAN9B516_9CAEN
MKPTASNGSISCFEWPAIEKYSSVRVLTLVLLSFIALLTCLFNLTTIVVFIKMRKTNYTERFIFNLAIADLCVGLFAMPVTIFMELNNQWLTVRASCLLGLSLRGVSVCVSLFNVLVISVDRYLMSVWPIVYRNLKSKCLLWTVLLGPWLLALVVVALPLLVLEAATGDTVRDGFCFYPYSPKRGLLLVFVLVLLVPIVGNPVFSGNVFINAHKRLKRPEVSRASTSNLYVPQTAKKRASFAAAGDTDCPKECVALTPPPSQTASKKGKGATGTTTATSKWSRLRAQLGSKVMPLYHRGVTINEEDENQDQTELTLSNTTKNSASPSNLPQVTGRQPSYYYQRAHSTDRENKQHSSSPSASICTVSNFRSQIPRKASTSQSSPPGPRTSAMMRPRGALSSTSVRRMSFMGMTSVGSLTPLLKLMGKGKGGGTLHAKARRRLGKSLMRMVMVFLVCSLPYIALSLLHVACLYTMGAPMTDCNGVYLAACFRVTMSSELVWSCLWLLLISSLLNPLLYPFSHRVYRQVFLNACCKRRERQGSMAQTTNASSEMDRRVSVW